MARATTNERKISLGAMRSGRGGTRGLLVSCVYCGHHTTIAPADADKWPDDVSLTDLGDRFVCQRCGRRGADVRPDFHPPRMGTGSSS